jgi:hypothetical protein
LFYVAFIGQSIVAVSQVFILSLPAKLAAVWFGPNQVSSACSIGVFGNQVSVTTMSWKNFCFRNPKRKNFSKANFRREVFHR